MACTDRTPWRTAAPAALLAALLAAAVPGAARAQAPAAPPAEASEPHAARAGVERILAGLAGSMERAGTALRDGRRRDATRALNDARRAATFADETAGGAAAGVAARALATVRHGRHALQNGAPLDAATILLDGSRTLQAAAARLPPTPPAAPVPLDGVAGLDVIDADGTRLGEIDRIVEGEDGARHAVLRVGGVTDFAGFLDWGNDEATVALDELILGPSMAALTESVDADTLAHRPPPHAPAVAER